MTLKEIGKIKSRFTEKEDPFVMRKHESRIILNEEFTEGLYRLAENSYIRVIFGFHLSTGYSLKGPVYTGEIKGVFASRSPNRPSPIGTTTVKLIRVDKNELTVSGLDAIDGSPVYDIKPYSSVFDEIEAEPVKKEWNYTDPRSEMIRYVRSHDLKVCLLKAGSLHGHFCPGLSSGVYASVTGLNKIFQSPSDGMEKLLAITETNSCFADGIQAITGCTFGNNSLIYHDIGKTAVTFVVRGDDTGLRIRMKPDFHSILSEAYPEFSRLFTKVIKERAGTEEDRAAFKVKGREAAFGLLSIPFDSLFDAAEVKVEIPLYAPIFDNRVCSQCNEEFMGPKAVKTNSDILCRKCAGIGYPSLTGEGIITH
ncbi:MAG: SAM-dependent methyltransferase [Spirochaetales bacterium]|nr:SAM-dependent methyltransferase [Spirochaetales bacterium]